MEPDLDWDSLARTFQKLQIWTHTAKPPFYCEVCDKTFPTAQALAQEKGPASNGFKQTVHKHADTDEKAEALSAQVKELGISMSKTLKKWEAHKMSKDGAGKATFIGDHSVIVLAEYDMFIDMHTPEDVAERYELLGVCLVDTYEAIHDLREDTLDNRKIKAEAVRTAAVRLAKAWEDVVPDVKIPYMHIALEASCDEKQSNRKNKVTEAGEQGQVLLHENERNAVMHIKFHALSRAQMNMKRKAEKKAGVVPPTKGNEVVLSPPPEV
ncbi:hypothetical protein CYMTET_42256 [Cymbomonas tetramitiformis]|uniref:Uncharacterized protein n=1 Tax=Cymbomonas tetramitiformis TaxID=36881 RepID=A0AAE0C6M0_9CHLO|nr:hypothetical protein CYMTET_42256 [Cymbomonas tetramitiformis]